MNAGPSDGGASESPGTLVDVSSDDSLSLPSERGFKLASLNINSLSAHIDELKIYLSTNDLDVLAINEMKLDPSE